jgi:hypothetical protein
MGQCNGSNPKRLYDCTEVQDTSSVSPTNVADAQKKQHRWYIDQNPPFYSPYFIRVVTRDDQNITFKFLDSFSGNELFSGREHKIEYHNLQHAWPRLPSTAHLIEQGTGNDCGLLFISLDYMMDSHNLPGGKADLDNIKATGGGDGKWPYSAGELLSAAERLRASLPRWPEGILSNSDRRDLESILRLVESAARI